MSADDWCAMVRLATNEERIGTVSWRLTDRPLEKAAVVRWKGGTITRYWVTGKFPGEGHVFKRGYWSKRSTLYPTWPAKETRFLKAARMEAERARTVVIRWRPGMNGTAHCIEREIEAPVPAGRKSLYIFLHEVGHVVMNHQSEETKSIPRYLIEYAAEKYAARRMRELGFRVPLACTRSAKDYVYNLIWEQKGPQKVDSRVRRFVNRRRAWVWNPRTEDWDYFPEREV